MTLLSGSDVLIKQPKPFCPVPDGSELNFKHVIGGLKQSASETNGKFTCNTQNAEYQIIRSSKHFRIVFVSLSELKFWLSWTSTKYKLYLPVLLVLGLKRHVLRFVQYNRLLMIS